MKVIKILGIALISLGFFFLLSFKKEKELFGKPVSIYFENTEEYNSNISNEDNNTDVTIKNQNNNILGYIELPSYKVVRAIKKGTNISILNNGYVGMLNASSDIESDKGNIILAGHNNSYTFKALHKIKIGDEINIITNNKKYSFHVTEKNTININDLSYFKEEITSKKLTLITCTDNKTERLIVIAKEC